MTVKYECAACRDTGLADYAAVPCEACGGTSRRAKPAHTEQKPYAYIFHSLWAGKVIVSFNSPPSSSARDVRPLFEHLSPAQSATVVEHNPSAWAYEQCSKWTKNWLPDVSEHRPEECETIRNVRPLYEHPAPLTEQKPVAWSYTWAWGEVLTRIDPTGHKDVGTLRDLRPLYEHPAPSQPATDPAVEAARRKALRAIFKVLAKHPEASDWTPVVLDRAVLRDLVGEARRDPLPVEGYDFRECE